MGGEAATLGCGRKGFLDCSNHPEITKGGTCHFPLANT